MARYLTALEFIERIGEREAVAIAGVGGFNTREGRSIDNAAIEVQLKHADDLINGYVLTRHPWLADTATIDQPDLLKGFAGDIARYRLRDKAGATGQVTDTVEARYRDALKMLSDIQRGKLDLAREDADGVPATAAGDHDQARIVGPCPTVEASLKGWLS